MISEQQLEEKMKQVKPKLSADPAFTARVMDQLAAARAHRPAALGMQRWSLAIAALVLAIGAGASVLVARYIRELPAPAATVAANQSSGAGSQSGGGSKRDAAYYQQLAASVQKDNESITSATNSFSDSDYSDSLLADSAVF